MEARCQCGKLRARVDDEARPFTVACHCVQCQQRSGSPFGVIAYFPQERVHLVGEAREFTRGSHAGTTVTNRFCPACGSTVCVMLEKNPALVGVPVGAFGDSNFPPPHVAVWGQEKHHWLELPDNIRLFVKGTEG